MTDTQMDDRPEGDDRARAATRGEGAGEPPVAGSHDLGSGVGAGDAREGDYDLIRRAQAGEERAFELLVRRFERRAWRVARNMVPSDEDAQDIAQEAFLRVFRHLERFDFKHEFSTWLYRIVTNLAIDHLRRRRPAVSTTGLLGEDADLDPVDEHAPSPSAGLEQVDTAREVHACLAALPEHFRSVMVLRELEGLPCINIADIVGATHVTVRWRLHRGRKLFQEEWERRSRLAAIRGGLPGDTTNLESGHPPDANSAGKEA